MAHLTSEQRYEIFAFCAVGFLQVEIAEKIGKPKPERYRKSFNILSNSPRKRYDYFFPNEMVLKKSA